MGKNGMEVNRANASAAQPEGPIKPPPSQSDVMGGDATMATRMEQIKAEMPSGQPRMPETKTDTTSTTDTPIPPTTAPLTGENKSAGPDTAQAAPAIDPDAKPFKSRGWKIHNELTYRGLDWIANSSVGVATAYWTSRTESGDRVFQQPVSGFFKKILKPLLKNEASIAEGAKWGTSFAGIMAGGFAIIPPMMLMENKKVKKKIVRWLDEKTYGKEVVANDPKFEAAYQRIDEEPEKGFGIGLVSRFIAIIPLITAASIPTSNMWLMKNLYDPIAKGSKWMAGKLGIKPGRMLVEGAMEHLDGNPNTPKQMQSNWEFLHRTIGFDFGLTIFYAIFHEAAYKALAAVGMRKFKAKKNAQGEFVSVTEPAETGFFKKIAPDEALLSAETSGAMRTGEAIPEPHPRETGNDLPGERVAESAASSNRAMFDSPASEADRKFSAGMTRRESAESIRALAEQGTQESSLQRTVDKGPKAGTESPMRGGQSMPSAKAENFSQGVQQSREMGGLAPALG